MEVNGTALRQALGTAWEAGDGRIKTNGALEESPGCRGRQSQVPAAHRESAWLIGTACVGVRFQSEPMRGNQFGQHSPVLSQKDATSQTHVPLSTSSPAVAGCAPLWGGFLLLQLSTGQNKYTVDVPFRHGMHTSWEPKEVTRAEGEVIHPSPHLTSTWWGHSNH